MKKKEIKRPTVPKPDLEAARKRLGQGEATAALSVQMRQMVEQLWMRGLGQDRVARVVSRETGVSELAVKRAYIEVHQRSIAEHEEERPAYKAQAIKRIHDEIKDARAEKQFGAVAAFESLLSKIQGTQEPLKISLEVSLHVAVVQCLGSMDVTQLDALVSEYQELEQRASLALPAPKRNVVSKLPRT